MNKRKPILQRAIVLSTLLALPSAALLSGADVTVNARLHRTETGVRIDIQQNTNVHGFCRVDATTNLSAWNLAGRFEMRDSVATVELNTIVNQGPAHWFYRLVSDNSVSNLCWPSRQRPSTMRTSCCRLTCRPPTSLPSTTPPPTILSPTPVRP